MFNISHNYNITNSDKLVIEKKWLNDGSRDLVTVIAHTHTHTQISKTKTEMHMLSK